MSSLVPATTVDDLGRRIPDGASLALAPDYSGCAMAVIRALIRRGVRDLRLVGVPQLGLQADLLIGAGCVRSLEAAAVTLGEAGSAPRFVAALRDGTIAIRDSTCPAIHAGLQAAEKGVPFLPLRGILGSDLVHHRPDWRVIDNPFAENDPILLVPAIRPDVALFHAARADRAGNVWIGVRRELMLMAHAARATLVTVEAITEDDLLADDVSAAGTIPALYITAIAEARGGAWPVGLRGHYPPDSDHLASLRRPRRERRRRVRPLSGSARARGGMTGTRPQELLIDVLAEMLTGLSHVAVGAASPIPGAAALLARARAAGGLRVSILGSERHNPFTDGGRELFDCAAQGRIDAFFLGGGQIDGSANINLIGVGGYPQSRVRWPGSFGSAYLYFLVPRVILFREEHTGAGARAQGRVHQRAGHEPGGGRSPRRAAQPGDRPLRVPLRCRTAARFRLASLHHGHSG